MSKKEEQTAIKKKKVKTKKTLSKTTKTILLLPFVLLTALAIYTYVIPKDKFGNGFSKQTEEAALNSLEQKVKALELWRISIHDEISEIKQIYEESREVGNDLTSLTAKVNEAYRNIEQIENQSTKNDSFTEVLLAISINQLLYTMSKNSPFDNQIEILISSIANKSDQYSELINELNKLEQVSKVGAPNISSLLINFDYVAKSILLNQNFNENNTNFNNFKSLISRWVLIRKIENVQQNENNIDYILYKVEENLKVNNLQQAIAWFEKIDINQNDIANNWLKDAKNRLLIQEAIQEIYNITIKTISRTTS